MFKSWRNIKFLSIDFKIVVFIIDNGKYLQRGLLRISNFQKWMGMFEGGFAFFTEVKVWTNWTFVASTRKVFLETVVTSDSFVNQDRGLFFNDRSLIVTFHFIERVSNRFFFLDVIFCDLGLIWNSWSLRKFFWNFRFDLGDEIWKKFLEFFFNHTFIDFRNDGLNLRNNFFWFVVFLFWRFRLFLNLADLFFNLYFFSHLNEVLIDFYDVDLDSFLLRSEQDEIVLLVMKCDLVSVFIDIAESIMMR